MQPAILWRFFVSRQIEFRKTQVAIALAAAFASGATFAATPTADVIDPGGYSSVQLTDFALISEQTLVNNTSNGTGVGNVEPFYIDNLNGTSTSYTVTAIGAYDQAVTTSSGSVLAEANGNLTLSGGSVTTDTSTYDVAVTFLTNNSTGLPIEDANGTVISGNATGLYNSTTGEFTPNVSVNTTESTYLGGGNLTMDGNAVIKNGILVSTRDEPAGEENSGRGRLLVDGVQAQMGAINGYGALNGITSNANGTSITGGSGGWGWNSQARVELQGTNASLTNSNGKGIVVTSSQTQISGGSSSTYLTLGNTSATFSSNANGTGPITVTGIADGSNPYDAVNMRTFDAGYSKLNRRISDVENKSYGGIAAAVALAGIPAPAAGKQYTVGAGWGNYEGENAFALGGRAQITPEFQLTAGWGYSSEGNAFNVGAGYSW
jgi:hypothetical protein